MQKNQERVTRVTYDVRVICELPGVGFATVHNVSRGKNPLAGWGLPGGSHQPGRDGSLESAALRELWEETGIRLPEDAQLELVWRFDKTENHVQMFFRVVGGLDPSQGGGLTTRNDPTRHVDVAEWTSYENLWYAKQNGADLRGRRFHATHLAAIFADEGKTPSK